MTSTVDTQDRGTKGYPVPPHCHVVQTMIQPTVFYGQKKFMLSFWRTFGRKELKFIVID